MGLGYGLFMWVDMTMFTTTAKDYVELQVPL